MPKDLHKNIAFLLLGSNIGQRKTNIERAIIALGKIGSIVKKSHYYQTEPWGANIQQDYYNTAVELHTRLNAEELLQQSLEIEESGGRNINEKGKYLSRTIDIDILFFNQEIINKQHLQIPHPMIPLRNFAIIPMMEIAAEYEHPLLKKNIEELYIASQDELEVILLENE